ncbi:uncharacterized protein LOC127623042 [Xyrauchen texanus]|uniref:uncharacterized protein LOC127623042 n=1 Tax=Xyrauchen texanus TaxID=154827 RepID=UPI00224212BD|nr:uncharacterized protein LOC127623042 [Xyrauchen texanus]
MDSDYLYLIVLGHVHQHGAFAENVWTNTLQIMYELNVKNHTRMSYVYFFKLKIFVAAEEQLNIIGAWFISANFTEVDILNEPTVPGLNILLPYVTVSGGAVKALICSFLRHTDYLTMPSSICVCNTMRCKCVLSLHRSLCMISPINGDRGTSCDEFEQFIHIWMCSQDQQRALNKMDKIRFRLYLLTCMWDQKEISPLQWQIYTQLFNRGLFHQWIVRVLLMSVSMFFIGQPAVLTYISYKQIFVSIHRVRNSNLSFLLFFTISWYSLSSLTVSGQSTGCSNKPHHTEFGLTFVLCISCVVRKTIVVLLAFKATLPVRNVRKSCMPLPPKLSVPAFTLTQIFVRVFWFSIQSPSSHMMDFLELEM